MVGQRLDEEQLDVRIVYEMTYFVIVVWIDEPFRIVLVALTVESDFPILVNISAALLGSIVLPNLEGTRQCNRGRLLKPQIAMTQIEF